MKNNLNLNKSSADAKELLSAHAELCAASASRLHPAGGYAHAHSAGPRIRSAQAERRHLEERIRRGTEIPLRHRSNSAASERVARWILPVPHGFASLSRAYAKHDGRTPHRSLLVISCTKDYHLLAVKRAGTGCQPIPELTRAATLEARLQKTG